MFDFEWTQTRDADDSDEERGIAAAERYCIEHDLDPEEMYRALVETGDYWPLSKEDQEAMDAWLKLEDIAIDAMCRGWYRRTENATLIWVE